MEERRGRFEVIGEPGQLAEVNADDVLSAIAKLRDVNVEYAVIDGDLDVGKIADHLERNENDKLILRKRLRIIRSNIRGNINFGESIFLDHVSFRISNFNGIASFAGCIFRRDTYFGGAVFGSAMHFDGSVFAGDVDFNCCIFNEIGYFRRSSFLCNLYLAESIFAKDVYFGESVFSGKAQFDKASFREGAYFDEATFEDTVFFNESVFGGIAYFERSRFNRYVYFDNSTFDRAMSFGEVKMDSPASFDSICFRENTVSVELWNHFLQPSLSPILRLVTMGKVSLKKRATTHFLKFNTDVVMDRASNPRLKRYIDDEQWIKSWRTNPEGRWWREPVFRFWEFTSHCGRSIGLWAFWSAFFALVFAIAYTPNPEWMPDWWRHFWQDHGAAFEQSVKAYEGQPVNFWSCLYFSVVNFTTLGFGDIVAANPFARFLVGLEVVIGYVMLGGLISIFANKFARWS